MRNYRLREVKLLAQDPQLSDRGTDLDFRWVLHPVGHAVLDHLLSGAAQNHRAGQEGLPSESSQALTLTSPWSSANEGRACVKASGRFLSGHQAALEPRSAHRSPPPRLCACLSFASSHPHLNTLHASIRPALLLSSIFSRTSWPPLLEPGCSAPLSMDQPLRDRPDFRSCPRGDSLLTIYHTTKTLEEK